MRKIVFGTDNYWRIILVGCVAAMLIATSVLAFNQWSRVNAVRAATQLDVPFTSRVAVVSKQWNVSGRGRSTWVVQRQGIELKNRFEGCEDWTREKVLTSLPELMKHATLEDVYCVVTIERSDEYIYILRGQNELIVSLAI